MHSKSISLIEFHYAKLLYTKNHYDYIYHEHIFYYTLRSIMYLLNKHKLYGFDCFESPISGGSIVLVISIAEVPEILMTAILPWPGETAVAIAAIVSSVGENEFINQ